MDGKYVPSLLAALGEIIEKHMIQIGFLPAPERSEKSDRPVLGEERRVVGLNDAFRQCPKCAQPSLIRQEGCDVCSSCGYSKCG
jgi:ribonucleoside-diphosphate reductase alpha chain